MVFFVFFCAGTACTSGAETQAGKFEVALAFGTLIMVLAYAIGHHSGGQINCAVTIGLCALGKIPPPQAAVNVVAQLLGSISGAALLAAMVDENMDMTRSLGSNMLSPGYESWQALIGEVMGTFLLMYTVLETAVNMQSDTYRMVAPIAIGFSVFIAHCLLIPIDGCSINPSRSFGPAVIATITDRQPAEKIWEDHWVFWVGPIVGALLGVGVFQLLRKVPSEKGESL